MTRSVRIVQGLEAMRALVPAWDELASVALEPNPFYESWMLLPALEAFGLERNFRLVTIGDGDRLDAVLPFERTRGFKGLPLPALGSWLHRHCLLCTPLVRAEGASETLSTLVEWLKAGGEGASIVNLRYIPSDGPFHRALVATGVPCAVLNSHARPILRRAKSGEAYISEFIPGKDRQEVRRRERRLREHGQLSHVVLEPGEDVTRWIDDFLRLEAAGWKGREGSAMICSEANRRFLTETFTAAHRRGRLEMVGVDLDGKPLARCTGFIAGEGAYAFKPAYDEAFAKFSPGIIAELARIRNLHERPGFRWMDSYTDTDNTVLSRLWRDRLTVQSLAFGTSTAGALAVATWPFLRWAKQQGKRLLSAASRKPPLPAPPKQVPVS